MLTSVRERKNRRRQSRASGKNDERMILVMLTMTRRKQRQMTKRSRRSAKMIGRKNKKRRKRIERQMKNTVGKMRIEESGGRRTMKKAEIEKTRTEIVVEKRIEIGGMIKKRK